MLPRVAKAGSLQAHMHDLCPYVTHHIPAQHNIKQVLHRWAMLLLLSADAKFPAVSSQD
jgi:hypothetical protein